MWFQINCCSQSRPDLGDVPADPWDEPLELLQVGFHLLLPPLAVGHGDERLGDGRKGRECCALSLADVLSRSHGRCSRSGVRRATGGGKSPFTGRKEGKRGRRIVRTTDRRTQIFFGCVFPWKEEKEETHFAKA